MVKTPIAIKINSSKKPIVTKNKKDLIVKTKYNKEFIQEFREAYASIIYDMCNSYTFHDDSACFFEAMCQRYTTDRFKYFTYIY